MEIDKSTVIIFRGIIKISHEGSKLSGEASLNPERERERSWFYNGWRHNGELYFTLVEMEGEGGHVVVIRKLYHIY